MDRDAFVFSYEPGGHLPPYPDTMSHAFSALRRRADVPDDVHLHSLRHFQSTELDRVISESQKQARLGWATVHMAYHYTGAVTREDRRSTWPPCSVDLQGGMKGGEGPAAGADPCPETSPSKSRSTARLGIRRRPLMVTTGSGRSPRSMAR